MKRRPLLARRRTDRPRERDTLARQPHGDRRERTGPHFSFVVATRSHGAHVTTARFDAGVARRRKAFDDCLGAAAREKLNYRRPSFLTGRQPCSIFSVAGDLDPHRPAVSSHGCSRRFALCRRTPLTAEPPSQREDASGDLPTCTERRATHAPGSSRYAASGCFWLPVGLTAWHRDAYGARASRRGSCEAVEIAPASLPAASLAKVLAEGDRLESLRRWGEALTHYEAALRDYPGNEIAGSPRGSGQAAFQPRPALRGPQLSSIRCRRSRRSRPWGCTWSCFARSTRTTLRRRLAAAGRSRRDGARFRAARPDVQRRQRPAPFGRAARRRCGRSCTSSSPAIGRRAR